MVRKRSRVEGGLEAWNGDNNKKGALVKRLREGGLRGVRGVGMG